MGTRNRKQIGYIYKRDEWWWMRYRQRSVVDGKIRTVQRAKRLAPVGSKHKTKASVRSLAEEFLEPINRHRPAPELVTTLGEFVENIYLPHVKQHKRPSTHKGYSDMWKRHLQPRYSRVWFRDVRTSHVQRWLEQIAQEDGISKTTLKHIKHLLSGVFRYAMQQDHFDSGRPNPVTAASIPADAPNGGETYAYSLEEVTKMWNLLPEPAATVVATAALTGLRRGEIRGLLWENFVACGGEKMATLKVGRSIWNGIVTEPKTEKSKALVPVIPALASRLELHRVAYGNRRSGPIFTNKVGKPLDLNELYQHEMADVFRRSGIKWHGWHGFRRGLATNLHRWGVDDKTIQAILRHSNIATTQNVYIKHVPEQSVAAMKRLEAALSQRQAVN